jgi:hypothetical protein
MRDIHIKIGGEGMATKLIDPQTGGVQCRLAKKRYSIPAHQRRPRPAFFESEDFSKP